ncbi:MAG: hypothetical protein RLZZ234_673 [Candidatus Parcubacteria bacterium]|jgi:hypothetical protein
MLVTHTAADSATKKLLIDLSAEPYVPDGLTLEVHQKPTGQNVYFKWNVHHIKLVFGHGQKNRGRIHGHKLRIELANAQTLNANALDFLLADTKHIPADWRARIVCFWGTVYRRADGESCVRFLHWSGEEWRWGIFGLSIMFDETVTAAVLSQ